VWVQKHGPVAESFRHLALQVRKELAARHASSVLVVSCGRGEGKTLTACNLALALASLSAGEKIALVELDLRVPGMARNLGVLCEVGFESVLMGERSLEECRVPTELSALDLYPVRRSVRQPHEWLTRPSVAATLLQLERSYEIVVCDGPPALPVPDVEIIAPHVGACLPVVRAGRTPHAGYRELVGMLPREKLIGTFLNCARPPRHTRDFYRQDYQQSPDEEPAEGA
jgi:Mrp family chromosome partitioning ATPase